MAGGVTINPPVLTYKLAKGQRRFQLSHMGLCSAATPLEPWDTAERRISDHLQRLPQGPHHWAWVPKTNSEGVPGCACADFHRGESTQLLPDFSSFLLKFVLKVKSCCKACDKQWLSPRTFPAPPPSPLSLCQSFKSFNSCF